MMHKFLFVCVNNKQWTKIGCILRKIVMIVLKISLNKGLVLFLFVCVYILTYLISFE